MYALTFNVHLGWFDLHDPHWKKAGQIRLTLIFTAKDAIAIKDPEYSSYKSPGKYFPPRKNCKVTLYQDADTPSESRQVRKHSKIFKEILITKVYQYFHS